MTLLKFSIGALAGFIGICSIVAGIAKLKKEIDSYKATKAKVEASQKVSEDKREKCDKSKPKQKTKKNETSEKEKKKCGGSKIEQTEKGNETSQKEEKKCDEPKQELENNKSETLEKEEKKVETEKEKEIAKNEKQKQ